MALAEEQQQEEEEEEEERKADRAPAQGAREACLFTASGSTPSQLSAPSASPTPSSRR